MPSIFRPSTTFGPLQPFGDLRTIIGQRGRDESFVFSRAHLDGVDLADGLLDRRRHPPVHIFRLFAFDEEGRPAAAAEELFQFLVLNAGENCRIADLEAVQVQDRQNRAVRDRIEQFVGLPGSRQGARFGLAIANDAGHDQPGLSNAAPKAWLSEYPSSPPS